jgi:hypothetical protein
LTLENQSCDFKAGEKIILSVKNNFDVEGACNQLKRQIRQLSRLMPNDQKKFFLLLSQEENNKKDYTEDLKILNLKAQDYKCSVIVVEIKNETMFGCNLNVIETWQSSHKILSKEMIEMKKEITGDISNQMSEMKKEITGDVSNQMSEMKKEITGVSNQMSEMKKEMTSIKVEIRNLLLYFVVILSFIFILLFLLNNKN